VEEIIVRSKHETKDTNKKGKKGSELCSLQKHRKKQKGMRKEEEERKSMARDGHNNSQSREK
jgi:hypothetical protein